jgi:PLP dependent protein
MSTKADDQLQTLISSSSSLPETMKPSSTRVTQLLAALSSINSRVTNTTNAHSITKPIRLVAVSKLKPLADIIALASSPPPPPPFSSDQSPKPHLHFGENYVQELLEKSRLLPAELQGKIRWHFIGGLQSNKAQTLARGVRGLWAVESVDSIKKANLLDKGRAECLADAKDPGEDGQGQGRGQLRVFVQVNTSGEESKSGAEPKSTELLQLCRHIRDGCENLSLLGLMTIGAIARSQATTAETENEDFQCLKETRDWVAEELGIEQGELELSMGMSEDFEAAIRMGSDEVRVGSTIFGERLPKGEAKVLPENIGDKT